MSRNLAAKSYADFRGFDPDSEVVETIPNKAIHGWHMGEVEGIMYRTQRDGETQRYLHKFKKKAAPSLVATVKGEPGPKLYLTGGDYGVTDRGIEDFKNMPPLIIANPHKRGTKAKKVSSAPRRKKRAAARKKSTIIVKASPIMAKRHRRTKRRSPATIIVKPNPVSRIKPRRKRRYAANPIEKTSRRRYRRDPIRGFGGKGGLDLKSLFMPAIMQAGGAVGTSIVVGVLPLPASLKTGSMLGATKAVLGLGIGYALSKFVSKKIGHDFALGTLTIAAYDAIKGAAVGARLPMGAIMDDGYGMGAIMDSNDPSLGFYTTANTTYETVQPNWVF